jgi:hypothetical protein
MMNTKKKTASLAMLDELEVRAVYLRVMARKYRRDIDILGALEPKIPLEALPHLRRAIRLRLQALGDAKMGEQDTLASQDFYQLHKRDHAR